MMWWYFLGIALSAIAGFFVALVVAVDVMPKIHSECKLPMPALPSYLFGHAFEFLDITLLLRKNMAWFAHLGEVFQIWIMHKRVVVTANPDDVKQILGNTDAFARPTAQTVLFNDLQPDSFQIMSRDIHKIHRARLRDVLNPKSLQYMHTIIVRVADSLVAALKSRAQAAPDAPIDLTPHLADTTFQVLLEAGLGSFMTPADRKDFAKQTNLLLTDLLAEYFTYPLRRLLWFTGIRRRLFRQNRICREYAEKLLAVRKGESDAKKADRPEDILDVIRELTPNDMSQQICNTTMFMIAGFESSSEALAWAIYEICGRIDVLRNIREEIASVIGDGPIEFAHVEKLHYLNAVWKEVLRLHPASGFLLRRAEKDTTLSGSRVFIPAGVTVGALIAGAQRHPTFVKDGDAFDPGRWLRSCGGPARRAFFPFSCGPERCPGQSLAGQEGVVILATLLRGLDIELACPKEKVVGISDWTERARSPAPDKGAGDTSWTVPVNVRARAT